jgi:hypothetical protein
MNEEKGAAAPSPVTREQALKALDDMDDFARMELGVDAMGARETLRRFIEERSSGVKGTQCAACGGTGTATLSGMDRAADEAGVLAAPPDSPPSGE